MTLVINILGASGSKALMVAPCGAVIAMVPVIMLVTQCSWRLLSIPRVGSALVEFTVSVLLRPSLLVQSCLDPWSGSAPAEVPGLGLVLQRSLVPVYSLGSPRLRCTRLAEDLPQAYPLRGPTKVCGSCLFPRRSQTHAQTSKGHWFLPSPQWLLPCTCSCGVCCFRPALA